MVPEPGGPPQYLADQLTLFQPWGADSTHPLLVAPPMFFTFRHHCNVIETRYFQYENGIEARYFQYENVIEARYFQYDLYLLT